MAGDMVINPPRPIPYIDHTVSLHVAEAVFENAIRIAERENEPLTREQS
jgi:hypothetical protein